MDNGFVGNIESNFYVSINENAFEKLFREYERVIFRSIITSFGLDLFIKDRYGGDVDTIINVRKIDTDSQLSYKNQANAIDYDSRGNYTHKGVEGTGTKFQEKKHEAKKHYDEDNSNTIHDVYTGGELHFLRNNKNHPTDLSAELDHVISAKTIHDDRGRVLSGCSTVDLADRENNLKWTNEHLNKSMRANEIPEYISKHPELPEDTKKRMMDAYNQSKAEYEEQIERKYYFSFSNPNCRQFYKDTALAASKRGLEMGLRQAFGFLLTDLWFSIKDEIKICDGTAKGCIDAIVRGLKNGLINAKNNYNQLFAYFGEGLLSGVLSSLTSTLCNIFFTTGKNLGRVIRQAWSSIVEAVSILFYNKNKEYLCDRMTSAAKVLATGASIIIGTGVQNSISVKLSEFSISDDLKEIISVFVGSLCTGLLSVSLLFYIDNDPFNKFLEGVYGQNVLILQEQCLLFKKYCAALENIDVERLHRETLQINALLKCLNSASSNSEVRDALQNTIDALNLPCLWQGSTLDEKMRDKDWRLTF